MTQVEALGLCVLAGIALGLLCGRIPQLVARLVTAGCLGFLAGLAIYAFGLVDAMTTTFPLEGVTLGRIRMSVPGFPLAIVFTSIILVLAHSGFKQYYWTDRYKISQAMLVAAVVAVVTVACRPWVVPIY